jgi:hypothetical protein
MGQGEVNALQGLARAAGGSLSINPETGLLEAGFLSKILPVVAGAGLAMIPGMAPLAPFLVGGITGLAKGDVMKGVTAGLGAYGGAGLASSLGVAGAGNGIGNLAGTGVKLGTETAGSTALGGGMGATESLAGAADAAAGSSPNLQYNLLDATSKGTLGASNAATSGAASFDAMAPMDRIAAVGRGATPENLMNYVSNNKLATAAAAAPFIASAMAPPKYKEEPEDTDPGQQYNYEANPTDPTPEPDPYGRGQTYFKPRYVNRAAAGGMMRGLPSAQSNLGSYSDGGRLLRGPGDGVSDSIPAVIGGKQPARLADGEFVIPARIVSELGNGSTEAGAKQLYAMMDRIQRARSKTTGKKQVAKNTKAHKLMPA